MNIELRNAAMGEYHWRLESPDPPSRPPDPPAGGGELAGDPAKSDYVYAPESIDPREPEPEPPTSGG